MKKITDVNLIKMLRIDKKADIGAERQSELVTFFKIRKDFLDDLNSKVSISSRKYKEEILYRKFFKNLKSKKEIFDSYAQSSLYYAIRHLLGRSNKIRSTIDVIRYISENLPRGSRVLDYGCGIGDFSIIFAKLGYDVTACDLDNDMLKFVRYRIKERGLKIKIQGVNATLAFPVLKDKFDFIFCRDVLEHTPDLMYRMKSIYRVLKPSGLFYTSTLNPGQSTYVGGGHLKETIREAKSGKYLDFLDEKFVREKNIFGLYRKKILIVLEGILGTGKTTIIDELARKEKIYAKINLKITKMFLRNMTNIQINIANPNYYFHLDELKDLIFRDSIAPINLMERNHLSTLAHLYSISKMSKNKEAYVDGLSWYLHNINVNLIKPDAYIILQMPINAVSRRLKSRRQKRVRNPLWVNAAHLKNVLYYSEKFLRKYEAEIPRYVVDATASKKSVVRKIKKIIEAL